MAEQLDLATLDLKSLKTEADTGLKVLIDALTVVEKFAAFLPGGIGTEVAAAVKILTSLKALVDKLP